MGTGEGALGRICVLGRLIGQHFEIKNYLLWSFLES